MNSVFPYDETKAIRVQPIVVGTITTIILLCTFLVDIGTPAGVATWVPYCIAIVLALQWRGAATIVPVTATALILLMVGFLLRPIGDFQTESTNRAIGAATLTALSLACLYIDWRRHKRRTTFATATSRLNRLRFFVNSLKRAAVVLSDKRGRVTEWNHAAQRLTGYAIEQMIGRPVFRILRRPEIGTVSWAQAYRKARTEERALYEAVCQRPNGSRCHVRVLIKPIRNQTGDLQGYSLALKRHWRARR